VTTRRVVDEELFVVMKITINMMSVISISVSIIKSEYFVLEIDERTNEMEASFPNITHDLSFKETLCKVFGFVLQHFD